MEPLNPFEDIRHLLAETSTIHPESRFSPVVNERGVYNKTLSDGKLIYIFFANEGGTPGVHGQLVGRIQIREDADWHIFELYPDERIWNFEKTEDSNGLPVTDDHWLDETEKQALYQRLVDINEQLNEVA